MFIVKIHVFILFYFRQSNPPFRFKVRFGFQFCSRTGSLIAESGSKPKPRTSTVRKPAIMFIRLVPQNINICMWIIPLFGSFLFPIHSTYIYGYIFRALYRTLFTHTHTYNEVSFSLSFIVFRKSILYFCVSEYCYCVQRACSRAHTCICMLSYFMEMIKLPFIQ